MIGMTKMERPKVKWRDVGYGFFRMYLPGKFMGEVGWDSKGNGFKVTFEDNTLIKRYPGLEDAKRACEQLAKQVLEEALAAVLTKLNL